MSASEEQARAGEPEPVRAPGANQSDADGAEPAPAADGERPASDQPPPTAAGTDTGLNAREAFASLAAAAERMLADLRDVITQPDHVKRMRTWGIEQAADLIGRSAAAVRLAERDEESDLIRKYGPTPRDAAGARFYTLERINQYREHFGTRPRRPEGTKAIRVATIIFKGGAAKTTTSIHLAHFCAIKGYRTLLLDIDPQASATAMHGIVPSLDIGADDVINEALLENPYAIRSKIVPTHIDGLHLLPANLHLQEVDLALPNPREANTEQLGLHIVERLDAALATVEDDYDIIVLDCGPNLGSLTLNAVRAATGLLITIPPSMSDFGSASMFFRSMSYLYRSASFPGKLDFIRILITRHKGGEAAAEAEGMIRMLPRLANVPGLVLEPVMVDTVEIQRATNDLGSVYEVGAPRRSREAYKRATTTLDATNEALLDVFRATWARVQRRQLALVGEAK